MSLELLKALNTIKARWPIVIQMQYLANVKGNKFFYWTSPYTEKKLVALWNSNQDLREMIAAFVNNKWDKIDLGNPKVIMDLGSNNGYSSLYFAERFPKAKIYLADLLQSNTLFGSKLFSLNQKEGVHVTAAVSNIDGLVEVDLHPAHSRNRLSSLLDDDQKKVFGFSNENIRVATKRLKTLLEDLEIDQIDLLKVDIEGAEQYLIEDIDNWSGFVDAVLLEVHHNIDIAWCEQQITGAGYAITKEHGDWYLTK